MFVGTQRFMKMRQAGKPWTHVVVSLIGTKRPWMNLTLDAFDNNGLLRSLRRGARQGNFRYSCSYVARQRRELSVSYPPSPVLLPGMRSSEAIYWISKFKVGRHWVHKAIMLLRDRHSRARSDCRRSTSVVPAMVAVALRRNLHFEGFS